MLQRSPERMREIELLERQKADYMAQLQNSHSCPPLVLGSRFQLHPEQNTAIISHKLVKLKECYSAKCLEALAFAARGDTQLNTTTVEQTNR